MRPMIADRFPTPALQQYRFDKLKTLLFSLSRCKIESKFKQKLKQNWVKHAVTCQAVTKYNFRSVSVESFLANQRSFATARAAAMHSCLNSLKGQVYKQQHFLGAYDSFDLIHGCLNQARCRKKCTRSFVCERDHFVFKWLLWKATLCAFNREGKFLCRDDSPDGHGCFYQIILFAVLWYALTGKNSGLLSVKISGNTKIRNSWKGGLRTTAR